MKYITVTWYDSYLVRIVADLLTLFLHTQEGASPDRPTPSVARHSVRKLTREDLPMAHPDRVLVTQTVLDSGGGEQGEGVYSEYYWH